MMLLQISLLVVSVGIAIATKNVPGRNTIVVTLPDIENEYYRPFYDKIVDFMIKYEQSVENENFIILADKQGIKNLRDRVDKGRFLYGPMYDIWMRDMTSAGRRPGGLALFKYEPIYVDEKNRQPIRDSFLKTMAFYDINEPYDTMVDAIADGGNIVDNGVDTAILTDRIYKDNKVEGDPEAQAKLDDEMKGAMKYENFIVIKEFPGDTLGHSDGYVTFINDKSLVISSLGLSQAELDDPKCWGDKDCERVKAMIKEIKGAVEPKGINAIVIPNKYNPILWRTFNNGCGAHVNSLVNDKYIYMPVFYDKDADKKRMFTEEDDDVAYDAFKQNTQKTIVTIFVPDVICRMGGNVRCLGWQPSHDISDKLIAAEEAAYDSYLDDKALDKLEEEYYKDEVVGGSGGGETATATAWSGFAELTGTTEYYATGTTGK